MAEKSGPGPGDYLRAARRELIAVALALVALVVVQSLDSEPNPEYVAAQEFLDEIEAAVIDLRSGEIGIGDIDPAEGFEASTGPSDGDEGTVVVGLHEERCFLVHWLGPEGLARAGVLDPDMPCEASAGLLATLPAPPLIENFPGTVPPLDASLLVTPLGAGIHANIEVFPAERTPVWFIPAIVILSTIALWQAVGAVLAALGVRRRPGAGVIRKAR